LRKSGTTFMMKSVKHIRISEELFQKFKSNK
jgi:hypothetical protein